MLSIKLIFFSLMISSFIASTDDKINELYILSVEAKNYGQTRIPDYIFPAKLDQENLSQLKNAHKSKTEALRLWEELATIYQYVDQCKTLPKVIINDEGKYVID